MSYSNQKEYDQNVRILELKEQLYSETTIGRQVDDILSRHLKTYHLKSHEFDLVSTLHTKGYSVAAIASSIDMGRP